MPDPLKTNWKVGDQFTPGDANTHAAAINFALEEAEAASAAVANLDEHLDEAVSADLQARQPQIILDPDDPTKVRVKLGEAVGPAMPGLGTWAGIPGKPPKLAAGATDVAARAAVGAASARDTVLGQRWIFDGDSVTINGVFTGGGNQDRSASWTTELAALSLGRINYVYNAAVAGQRSDERLAAFDTAVAPRKPDVVFLTVGTNDVAQGVAMSTWLTNLDAYLAKCQAIDAALVIGAIWPTDQTSVLPNRQALNLAWNTALYVWGETNGVTVVPWDRLADPLTGGWPTGWSTDQIHPTLLDSYSRIGKFAWEFLQPKVGPGPGVRRAVINSEGLLPNGFFIPLGSVTAVPAGRSATASTSAGTLPAGTYSYKVTGRSFFGEGLPSAEFTATLSGVGQISVAASTPSGARGINIYRKGPGDSDWRFMWYMANGTSPWVDDGSVAPSAVITGVDTSAAPTGLVHGTANVHSIDGPWIFSEPGIRGNIIRLRKNLAAAADNDYVWANVTPGQVIEGSCLMRGTADGRALIGFRFRAGANDSGAAAGQVYAYNQVPTAGAWRLLHLRTTVPAGAATARFSFELAEGTLSYIDIAEARLAVVA